MSPLVKLNQRQEQSFLPNHHTQTTQTSIVFGTSRFYESMHSSLLGPHHYRVYADADVPIVSVRTIKPYFFPLSSSVAMAGCDRVSLDFPTQRTQRRVRVGQIARVELGTREVGTI